jgi:ATP-dependent DNA helicase RecG
MGQNSFKRLSIMKNTTDGFKISEEDLKMRGIGEVLGLKQSGTDEYKIANLDRDFDLFELACQQADKIIENNKINKYILLLYLFGYVDFIKNKDILN